MHPLIKAYVERTELQARIPRTDSLGYSLWCALMAKNDMFIRELMHG